jgi:anaerobic selenocysteine-containing dehydrogenase
VSWDEALNDIADHMIDVMTSDDGPGSIVWDQGTAQTNGGAGLGMLRTTLVLDTPVLDDNTEIGDHRPGVAVTMGKMVFCSSSDDLFHSDLIMIWGGNPIYTQIPNAHFMLEARYNGARIITIAPDFSASAVHADQWVPVKVATDAALGLSMAHVMIEEGIYNAAFVQEQTDLPLLVRTDSGRFLRESDLVKAGPKTASTCTMLPARASRWWSRRRSRSTDSIRPGGRVRGFWSERHTARDAGVRAPAQASAAVHAGTGNDDL